MDAQLTGWINGFAGRSAGLDWAMVVLARYSVYLLVFAVAIRWFWNSNRARDRHVAISCGAAAAAGLVINQVILLAFDRVRPYDLGITHLLIGPSADPSFPSDHATLAFAVAAMLLVKRDRFALAFTALAALLAVSRVYVGIHYLGDVVGGLAVGTVAALLVNALYKRGNWLDRRLVAIF
ncbi:MAG: phosphatase PAP2 family protein [Rhizobiales bacterium]|nr:phosphatase PAP2 family protein [Hyphomicrobiales bacterium]MBI3674417.1 phosphatase PAP2 family protein [Hyphomicrobiales bacterium]